MGIPLCDSELLTGRTPANKRALSWATKRVFFMTPQTMLSDMARGSCPLQQVILKICMCVRV